MAYLSLVDVLLEPTPDVAPPSSALGDPLVLFGIAVFGFAVVMVVWIRRRRSAGAR